MAPIACVAEILRATLLPKSEVSAISQGYILFILGKFLIYYKL